MKKKWLIFYREPQQDMSFEIKRMYKLGRSLEFFKKEEAEHFLQNSDNSSLFEENCQYFTLCVFEK
jgi:hypothetical protein